MMFDEKVFDKENMWPGKIDKPEGGLTVSGFAWMDHIKKTSIEKMRKSVSRK
jgi:hypothetical protein